MRDEDRKAFDALENQLASLQLKIQEHINAVGKYADAAERANHARPPVLAATLSLPKTEETLGAKAWRLMENVVKLLAVATAICLVCLTNKTLQEVKRQADLAESDNRPWLRITSVNLDTSLPNEPILTFVPYFNSMPNVVNGSNLRVEFVVKNVGKGVAQHINILPDIIFEPDKHIGNVIEAQGSCDSWRQQRPGPPFTWSAIFPGDEIRSRTAVVKPIAKGEVNHLKGRSGDYVSPILIGCVFYQTPRLYETRAIFYVMSPNDRFIELGKNRDDSFIHLLRDEHYEYAR